MVTADAHHDILAAKDTIGMRIQEPAFKGNSYIAYSGMQEAMRNIHLSVMFYARSLTDGLILFNGQLYSGRGDFISLAIKDGVVELRYDSGSGTAIIRSNQNITMDTWHTIVATRKEQEGSLSVNNEEDVVGRSPGDSRGLNLRLPLYIGGHEEYGDLPSRVAVQGGLIGCISEVEIDTVPLDLIGSSLSSANIENCEDSLPCERDPCKNGGTCSPVSASEYECLCTVGKFTGRYCETPINPCVDRDPCLNGGSCQPIGADYKCNCALRYGGKNCEGTAVFEYGASFNSDGFLAYPRHIVPRGKGSTEEIITLTFKTSTENGLIFWQGQKEGISGRSHDFVALGVRDTLLEFSYQLGSGEANIYSNKRVNDGEWHTVILRRTAKDGSMTLDGKTTVTGQSGGSLLSLNVKGSLYIGSTPDMETLTGGKYNTGFVGCVYNLVIQVGNQPEKRIHLLTEAEKGVNVLDCASQP
uniref:Basement membrane-specific heparan sulfate proteoglycan core protein-like n=1 Tax=Saccoglossus kowalevskii TaxID=10224 RepID=A0ABM0MF86_SACKO|nr:PREDICTED: basement membrane-specific heparan sulfate proteoglycan core protein-like [Saccoglossus kowalevskii]